MSWIYETNYSELETVAKRMSVQTTNYRAKYISEDLSWHSKVANTYVGL